MKGRGKIARICRKTIFRMSESKYKLYNWGKTEVNHNTIYEFTLNGSNQMLTQGTGDNQRNGDRIYASGFQMKVLLGQKFDRPNITWRFLVVSVPKNGGTMPYATLFENTTANVLLDGVNTDFANVVWQKYWKPLKSTLFSASAGSDTTKEFTIPKKFWIPRKKEYKFSADGGVVNDDRDLKLVVAAYDAFGTLLADNIGYVQIWQKFAYRDP